MKTQMTLLALPIALLMGCVGSTAVRYDSNPHYEHSDVYYRSGPPPYAPAHGYRHHYHNHDMIYDSGIRAYILVGLPDYYYDNGFYFRYSNIGWQFSGSLDSGWKVTDEHRVPQRLWNTRSKKHYYDNDRSRNDYRDNRNNYDNDKSRNDPRDNRNNYDNDKSGNDHRDNRDNYDNDKSRNGQQDNRGNSDKDQSRKGQQDNRGNSAKDQSKKGQQDNRGNSDKNKYRNDNKDKDYDRYNSRDGSKDKNGKDYRR